MILVDTSVWVDHLRHGDAALAERLKEGRVLIHTVVTEELACGRLKNREEVFRLLGALPTAPSATHLEFMAFIEAERLAGQGLGSSDIHLLAGARLSRSLLWTRDKALRQAAGRLGVASKEA